MLNLPEPTAGSPADPELEREVADLYVVVNTKKMRMVVADLNLKIEGVEAQQLISNRP
jgi:hypothetical protein